MAGTIAQSTSGRGILDREHRVLTTGAVLAFTAIAFEGLAVTTVAPIIATELRGLALYGWIFSAYLLAALVGTVVAGQAVDRRGPAPPAAVAVALFGVGLLLAAIAPTMPVLLAGRVVQGLGAGALGNCVYAIVNLRYDDRLRPSMLATVSSAYIVPSMVGPYLAGLIAERLGWRAVFWVLLPILALAAALTLPAFARPGGGRRAGAGRNRAPLALALAVGTGTLLSGLGRLPGTIGALLAAAGLALALAPLRALLPGGTLAARPGVPAAIATRGLFIAGYFAADTYLVLALVALHGATASVAGLVIATGSLAWTACAWVQARLDRRDGGRGRAARIRVGVLLLLVGALGMALVPWLAWGVLPLAIGAHLLAGLGIGLAHAAVGALTFAEAREGEAGAASAALQLADAFTPAVAIGCGGALLAIGAASGWEARLGIGAALGLPVPLLAVSALASRRLRPGSRPQGGTGSRAQCP